MSFSPSPCNIIHKGTNSNSQLYRKFIFSVIVFELVIVIVLVLYSTIKNSSYKNDKKQIKLQKQTQSQTNKQTNRQTKAQVIPTTLSIYETLKSGKSLKSKKIMNIGQNSLDIDISESVVLERNQNRTIKVMEMKREHSRESSNIEHENDKQNHNIETKEISQSYIMPNSQYSSYINIGNLNLSKDKASICFNILLGHFFVCGSFAIQICPQLATSIFSGGHCILVFILLVVNVFYKSNKEGQKIQCSIKSKINTTVKILILTINICLLTFVVTRMKQSYFNVSQAKCP